MKEQLEQRLEQLRAELESGQKVMVTLEARRTELGNTLPRLSGAIRVLEELLVRDPQPSEEGAGEPTG